MIRAAFVTLAALAAAACSTGPYPGNQAAAPSVQTPPPLAYAAAGEGEATDAQNAAFTAVGTSHDVTAGPAEDQAAGQGQEEFVVAVYDPLEGLNRGAHEFNRTIDFVFVKPVADVYGTLTPVVIQDGVRNVTRNLGEPRSFVNYILQGNGRKAYQTFWRFVINSTLGVGGFIDIAGQAGLEYSPTDFGITLARAGVPEGPYQVIPAYGPTTRRDSWASLVDIAMSPTLWIGIYVEGPVGDGTYAISPLEIIDKRNRNKDLIEATIWASPDTYVTERSIHLQRRRAKVRGEEIADEDLYLPEIP